MLIYIYIHAFLILQSPWFFWATITAYRRRRGRRAAWAGRRCSTSRSWRSWSSAADVARRSHRGNMRGFLGFDWILKYFLLGSYWDFRWFYWDFRWFSWILLGEKHENIEFCWWYWRTPWDSEIDQFGGDRSKMWFTSSNDVVVVGSWEVKGRNLQWINLDWTNRGGNITKVIIAIYSQEDGICGASINCDAYCQYGSTWCISKWGVPHQIAILWWPVSHEPKRQVTDNEY